MPPKSKPDSPMILSPDQALFLATVLKNSNLKELKTNYDTLSEEYPTLTRKQLNKKVWDIKHLMKVKGQGAGWKEGEDDDGDGDGNEEGNKGGKRGRPAKKAKLEVKEDEDENEDGDAESDE